MSLIIFLILDAIAMFALLHYVPVQYLGITFVGVVVAHGVATVLFFIASCARINRLRQEADDLHKRIERATPGRQRGFVSWELVLLLSGVGLVLLPFTRGSSFVGWLSSLAFIGAALSTVYLLFPPGV